MDKLVFLILQSNGAHKSFCVHTVISHRCFVLFVRPIAKKATMMTKMTETASWMFSAVFDEEVEANQRPKKKTNETVYYFTHFFFFFSLHICLFHLAFVAQIVWRNERRSRLSVCVCARVWICVEIIGVIPLSCSFDSFIQYIYSTALSCYRW